MPKDEFGDKWSWNHFIHIEPNGQQIFQPGPAGAYVHGEQYQQYWQYQQHVQHGQHGLDVGGHLPVPPAQNFHDVAATTHQFQQMSLSPDPHLNAYLAATGQATLPSGDWATGTQQQLPSRQWSSPDFNFNNFHPDEPSAHMLHRSFATTSTNDVLPSSSPTPGNCCGEAPALERSSEESNPYSIEPTIAMPSAHEQLAANYAAGSDEGKSEEGELSAESFLQTAINSAPQTTMYPIPPSYATVENPMSYDQYTQLRASESWRPQQLPYYAGSGIAGSTANRADSLEDVPHCFECPCGEECICFLCTAHPHNQTSVHHFRELYPFWRSDPANAPTGRQPGLEETLSRDAATVVGEHAGSTQVESPTSSAMHGFPDSAGYNPTDELYPGEPSTLYGMSSRNYTYFQYDFSTIEDSGSNPCSATTGTCRCQDGCYCDGCQHHIGHQETNEDAFTDGTVQ
ncbi:MAG: hypothetical protein L6R38_008277 [Xanthoria sp. 2 TBL-2021]|nr:MAG: hypothetical protein L6R38_008277 [Xanthoria sp. 2 TBL-2021]